MHKMDKLNDITLSMKVENKINCQIDCVYESENLMRVVGWAFGIDNGGECSEVEIEVFDAEQNPVDIKKHRVYRKDIIKLVQNRYDAQSVFGYEIGWEKKDREEYSIIYSINGNRRKKKVCSCNHTNNVLKLDENIWTLPYHKIVDGVIWEYNIDRIDYTDERKLYLIGWISDWDGLKDRFKVITNNDELESKTVVKWNQELNYYNFEIVIECDENINSIAVLLNLDGTDINLIEYSFSDIKKYMYKPSIIYTYIDKLIEDKNQIKLIGWGYVEYMPLRFKPIDICVKDAHGCVIEHKEKRFSRKDLSELLNDSKNVNYAYAIEWECNDSLEYVIEYSGNGLAKSESIEVSELLRQERERAYSYPSKKIMWKCISSQRIKDDIYYLKNKGIKAFFNIYNQRVGSKEIVYSEWRKWNTPGKKELEKQKQTLFNKMPKISIIVPTYRTPDKFLREMLDSVINQTYSNWELCIGDGSMDDSVIPILEEYHQKDSRIIYKKLDENYGISGNTNGALELANGDFIALLDHDDLLTPDALFEVVNAINRNKEVDVVYTDEDKVSLDLKTYFDPHFKPDFNLDLLRSCNYICHFFVTDKKIVDRVGGFRSECDGSQDYDFILRCTAVAKRIEHVSKCVYNWRCHPASTAMNPESKLYCYEAGKKALELYLKEQKVADVTVKRADNYGYYKVFYPVKEECLVSIIRICENNKNDDFEHEIRKKSSYKNIEFINLTKDKNVSNSRLLNEAVQHSKGKYIVFLHDGMEVITENWIEILLSNCMRDEVGITSPIIYNSLDEIVHAGYIIGLNGFAGRAFAGAKKGEHGYEARLLAQCDLSAVSRDCMMISKELFEKIGGFDENITNRGEDIDLCLKVREHNLLVLFTAYAEMKCDFEPSSLETMDELYLEKKWSSVIELGDYSYNVNFDLERESFGL